MRSEDNDIIDTALETLAYQRKCIDAQAILIEELRAELSKFEAKKGLSKC